ncbi:hypothetical protein R3P38DRAFT_3326653 [Favolaschia claudopus]|uniref:Histone H1 n=1 Tax=Favolaschia claudopus TaxID=2862362 RepID=A0AAW0A856_9AGAR
MLPQRGQRSQPPSGPLPLAPKQRLLRPPPPRQRRKTATKGATKPAAAHPPWREIINEIHHRASPSSLSQPTHLTVVQEATTGAENARTGLSQSALRKYAEEQYKLNTNAHISKLNRAIAHSVDKGDFVQPKGAAGKLKLAPKRSKSDEACAHLFSINSKPVSKTSKPVAKSATGVKKPKKPIVKKPTAAAAKPTTKKSTATKPATKKSAVKTVKKLLGGKTSKTPAKKSSSTALKAKKFARCLAVVGKKAAPAAKAKATPRAAPKARTTTKKVK